MDVSINVNDIDSCIVNPKGHVKALGIVRQICRAKPEDFYHMPKYKSGHWDGYISLMSSMSTFPSGLLSLVVDRLEHEGYKVELREEHRPFYELVTPDCLDGVTLRDYQIEAANRLLKAGRGVAKMATNSGKTEVMAAICSALDLPNTLIVVHLKDLMYQTAGRFENRLGTVTGCIGDGVYDKQPITVATVQTLASRLGDEGVEFNDNVLLMVDECHHTSSNQMIDVLRQIPGAYRFGFSGTPLKYEQLADMKLVALTGDVVCEVSNEYLIDEGYSAKPVIHIHVVEGDGWGLDYQEAYEECIVLNDQRNNIIAEVANTSTGVVLVLVNRIEHGKRLLDIMPDAIFVHGSDSSDYRKDILERMRSSSKGIFIASPIFDEGVDVPSVDVVIIAGGGDSQLKLLQRVGRGLRKKSGDNVLIVHDFIDDTNKYLLKHSDHRIDVYVEEGFDTELK